jgi:glycosyltransferase involved in cell wall biosynthesis
MRLLSVTQEYPPETGHGGIATQARRKAIGMTALGHDVTVLSHAGRAGPSDVVVDGVRVVRIAGPDARVPLHTEAARWLAWSVEVAGAVERLLAESQFDLVEFVEWGGEGFVWLMDRPAGQRPPAVVHVQGPICLLAEGLGWPEPGSDLHAIGTWMEAFCLRRADFVLSCSRLSALTCANVYGLDPNAIEVAHAGVDLATFQPVPREVDGPPTIQFVGRIAKSKGADVLVDAALAIAHEFDGLRVRMVGRDDTGLARTLSARAAAAGYPDLLSFAGAVDHAALPAELAAATVFCAPSPCEGGPGFVFLEAMACGVPVIGCAGTGIAEVVDDGVTGYLVPVGDAVALADRLRTLLADRARCERMGAAARESMVQFADTRDCVRQIAARYEGVVARACGRPASTARSR